MAEDDWARLRLTDIDSRADFDRRDRPREMPPNEDPLMGARWEHSYRQGFGNWGVGWGLQNSGGGPQGYGWGGGWQGGHGEILRGGRFGGGYGGAPELREPVSYAGRGPKGYSERSDERLRERVAERLTDDSWIDASEITLAVAHGEVTLEGTVPDRESKRRAERIAGDLPGVIDVHNRLRIAAASPASSSRSRA